MAKRIGIIGSGDVAKSLGAGFAATGHEVKLGSRDPAKLDSWTRQVGSRASAGTFAEAAGFGEIVVLATLWSGTENAIRTAGREAFRGKVVLDVTNPLAFEAGGPPRLAVGQTDSGGEQVQRWLPDSRIVKVFNTVGNAHFFRPSFPGGPPTMFLAGNDGEAKTVVEAICRGFGWEPLDVGGIEAARLLEPMCVLWVLYAIHSGTWNHAFKLLRKG